MDQIILDPDPKNFEMLKLEPINLDAWSWSPKFEFRLHSPGFNSSKHNFLWEMFKDESFENLLKQSFIVKDQLILPDINWMCSSRSAN